MTRSKSAAALCCALCCAAGASAFVPGGAAPPFATGRTAVCGVATKVDVVCPLSGVGGGFVGARRRHRRTGSLLGMTSSKGDANGSEPSDDASDASSASADKDASSSAKKQPLRAEKDAKAAEAEAKYERTYRIAQKRAEIESLLSGPDPPFDAEAEFAKIPGGIPRPVSMDINSSEMELETKAGMIEAEIYEAAEEGDWDTAQTKRDELSQEYLDDCGAVLQANLRFYRAFSAKDYGEMSKLWLHDASVLCVHPSHAPLVGASAVLASWKRMFDTGAEGSPAFRRNVVEPSRVRLSMRGATAILTCDEEVYTRRFVRGERRRTELVNKLTATNVFRKVAGRWRMVHHHAAWHAESDAAKRALGAGGGKTSSSRSSKAQGSSSSSSSRSGSKAGEGEHQGPGSVESSRGIPDHEGITGKGYGEKSDKKSDDDPFSALDGLSSLGGFGGGGSLNPDGSNGPVRRVFMGSLSDLLNGGLGDLLGPGSSDGKIIDASGKGGIGGKGFGDDNDEGPSIIRFFSEDDDDDEDEDDDDDDETDVSIQFVSKSEDGKSGGATIIRSIKKGDGDDDDVKSKKSDVVDATEVGSTTSGGVPKDALRQNCISALRRLATQGAISSKQKRVLLTDIIMCSARGEFSMVEVAYELLCGECADGEDSAENGCVAEERATAEEEFADQCRAFAASLPESPPYSPAR